MPRTHASTAGPQSSQVRRRERGAALIELAVALPVVAIILVGAIDFGRVFRMAMVVQNAARAAALYGAQSEAKSADTTGMRGAGNAILTANGLNTLNAVAPSRTCECATDAGVFSATLPSANLCTAAATCAVGSHMVITVSVTATQSFSMTRAFPGLPTSTAISRTATMRVLN